MNFFSNPLSFTAKRIFDRTLKEKGSALTFARLCTSRHLRDLQWIALLMVILIPFLLYFAATSWHGDQGDLHKAIAGALAGTILGVLSWVYQSGSRRLGVVDLFGCEISTICRVCLIVGFAESSVRQADGGTGIHPSKFTSQENYTPVYDNQLSDLEPLDEDVLTHVTRFYTYRKTMMDYLRALGEPGAPEAHEELMRQMIYMQFLMYESGRKAVKKLIEFEPNQAESLVNILCSELPTYTFLQLHYNEDYRGRRLQLRAQHYQTIVKDLKHTIDKKHDHRWDRVKVTFPELIERYMQMCKALDIKPDIEQ